MTNRVVRAVPDIANPVVRAVPDVAHRVVPTMASDDDDPTVADRLGLPSAAPADASELTDPYDDALGQPVGGDHP